MSYSEELVNFVKGWESYNLEPHWDALGGVWDIGYGHVILPGEERRSITLDECEELLRWDLAQVDAGVDRLVKVPLHAHQRDALVSFAFNVGLDIDDDSIAEGLGDSTLLRLVNECDFYGAADEFLKWNKAGGKVVRGLVKRRAAERAMFVDGRYDGRP
jgi:lysozyme